MTSVLVGHAAYLSNNSSLVERKLWPLSNTTTMFLDSVQQTSSCCDMYMCIPNETAKTVARYQSAYHLNLESTLMAASGQPQMNSAAAKASAHESLHGLPAGKAC